MSFRTAKYTNQINNPENFPTWAFGEKLEQVLIEIHQETNAPLSAIAAGLIMTISLVSQGKIYIRKKEGLVSPTSMWFLVIMESGERKTIVVTKLFKSVYAFTEEMAIAYTKAIAVYLAELSVWQSEAKGIEKQICTKSASGECIQKDRERMLALLDRKPKQPKGFKLIHENATPSAIIKNLAQCYPTTSLFSDEGACVFSSRSMSDLGLLNKCWDGNPITVDRVDDGSHVISDAKLTLGIFTQREVLMTFFEGKGKLSRSSGLLARSYVIAPPPTAGTRYLAYAVESAQDGINWFHERCREILYSHISDDSSDLPEKITLNFSPEAQVRWEREHDFIESHMLPGGFLENFRDFGSKHADKIARLSALLHFFDGSDGPISIEALTRAIEISEWFAVESVRCLTPEPQLAKAEIDAQTLLDWLDTQHRSTGLYSFKKNDVLKFGPNPLRKISALKDALFILVNRGFVWEGQFPG